ncbi:hypothetical protein K6Y31_00130 [Motilimonas cestriensis]|uniref:ABC transmembrane type-1 domain-containing protein n=1 Tax=Motilimonas cestriensis TaxID=2742685 RepID=A0ABS8W2P9_9GAMM|nr:hypothetical protein [Motilimonas cestriensis]MCE2593227.1 hypothetical protein [Motilimonas cestriensis]
MSFWLLAFCFIALFLLPLAIGLFGTLLPALNYLPSLGHNELSTTAFSTLFNHPTTFSATWLTLRVGWISTFISLCLALFLFACFYLRPSWRWINAALSPVLATPHAALAVGLSFVIAPSGWLLRLTSPALTGFDYPPNWQTTQDPWGVSLILLMVLKETPFLLLMLLSAAKSVPIKQTITLAQSMGYHSSIAWLKLVLPQLLPPLRLPICAVLAWSLSAVDVSVILGPSTPPTLSVLVYSWFNDADIALRLQGAAGAIWLLGLNLASIAVLFVLPRIAWPWLQGWLVNGQRRGLLSHINKLGTAVAVSYLILIISSLFVLAIWSITKQWRFPDPLPSQWRLRYWQQTLDQFSPTLINSLSLALLSAAIALLLSVVILELETRQAQIAKHRANPLRYVALFYLPLLIPDIAYLFGIQVSLVFTGLDGQYLPLLWGHLMFVLPYCFLSLAPYYRRFDSRYWHQAMLLSGSPWRSFFQIKLMMLLPALFSSLALGFTVSMTLYLPTLFIGGGRFPTLATELVALVAGADRRLIAVYALLLQGLPLLMFVAALALPRIIFRHRKGMRI